MFFVALCEFYLVVKIIQKSNSSGVERCRPQTEGNNILHHCFA